MVRKLERCYGDRCCIPPLSVPSERCNNLYRSSDGVVGSNLPVPIKQEVKYLGLHLDQNLSWKTHKSKRRHLELKVRNMNWLINRKSQLSLENKITIYKAIIKPVWTYGIKLWGCSKPSNTKILQTFQSKTLRKLANVPWYISNITLHNDKRIPYVAEVIRTYAQKHKTRTAQNNIQLIRDLFTQPEIGRRPNRMWPEDLIR
jgi:hypothetical protein